MNIEARVLLLLNALATALSRGPHHPHGQTPVDQKHHHYKPRDSELLTSDKKLLRDTQHIQEDSKILSDEDVSKMTPEELEFYYFSIHDYDKNHKLDGLELLKAIYHTMEHESESDPDIGSENQEDLDTFISLVDRTLATDDNDNDGYLSYLEFRKASMRDYAPRTPHVLSAVKS